MGFDKRGCFWFEEVPAEELREPVRRAAMEMLTHVERDLRLPPLVIRWFRLREGWAPKGAFTDMAHESIQGGVSRRTAGIWTLMDPYLIWIRTDLKNAYSAASIVAHEARHVWQYHRLSLVRGRGKERDAYEYMFKKERVASRLAARVEAETKMKRGRQVRNDSKRGSHKAFD